MNEAIEDKGTDKKRLLDSRIQSKVKAANSCVHFSRAGKMKKLTSIKNRSVIRYFPRQSFGSVTIDWKKLCLHSHVFFKFVIVCDQAPRKLNNV